MKRFKSVDDYVASLSKWQKEIVKLRQILNSTELQECVKWGIPCYTIDGKNVVGIAAFKDYFGLWFYQGVFLQDKQEVLVNQQEGKTRGMRQWRFQSASDIKVRLIKSYVKEAIDLAKAGKEIKPQRGLPVVVPDELASAFNDDPKAGKAFAQLGLGKQREYVEHIASAKRPETKTRRLEKILPMIKQGVGLNDKYR